LLLGVVWGQFLGIATLTVASAGAAMASVVIPAGWTALLGVVRLALGVQKLWQLRASVHEEKSGEGVRDREQALERRADSQVLAVAGVTIAVGSSRLTMPRRGGTRT
jgi:cadmium resistance protein CadD (predicted permease)